MRSEIRILIWRISSESEATVGALCGDSGVMPTAVSPDARVSIRHINPAGGCEALIKSIVGRHGRLYLGVGLGVGCNGVHVCIHGTVRLGINRVWIDGIRGEGSCEDQV